MIDFILALSFRALKRRFLVIRAIIYTIQYVHQRGVFAGIFGPLLALGNDIGMHICLFGVRATS